MKLSIAFLPFCSASIAVTASNDKDHSFIRRAQAHPPPQCGASQCWCDMVASNLEECPAYPYDSIYTVKPDVANFFASLDLENPEYKDLQLCYPDLSTSVNYQGVKVDPMILCNEGILVEEAVGGKSSKKSKTSKSLTKCMKKCKRPDNDSVCGMKFMHDGSSITPSNFDNNCMSESMADSYIVRTFRSDKKLQERGYFKLHDGGKE